MNNILEDTEFLMKKYKIRANKSLGQNFLIDDEVVEKIVDSSNVTKEDLIIEIGPGLGTLTSVLLEKAYKVISIELDEKMIEILNDRFRFYDNFELINQDVLKVNLNELIKKEKEDTKIKSVKIIANLPYYITTPIIMKLLEEEINVKSITVMIQKEVAERLIAIPGEKGTGAITYTVYYYAESEKIAEVSKKSFIPAPKVTSEIIKLNIRKSPEVNVSDKNLMFKIIKCAFTQKRKTLVNALTNTKIFSSKDEGYKILKELNLREDIRPEKLTLQDFANIAEKVNIKNN